MFFFALSAFIIMTIIVLIFPDNQRNSIIMEFEKRRQDFDKEFAERRKRFEEEHEKHFSHSNHLGTKPPITIKNIPDNKIAIEPSTRRGTVIEVRKNMSYGSEVREDQNVHVRPIVEHHLVEILDSTQNT